MYRLCINFVMLSIAMLLLSCSHQKKNDSNGSDDETDSADAGDSNSKTDSDASDTIIDTTIDTTEDADTADTTPDTEQESDLSFEERATALVAEMTLEEKASQLGHDAPPIYHLDIPDHMWWNEALHGVARAGIATVFPQSIALAGTFDPELIHEVASVISTEARVMNNVGGKDLTYWSPTVNLARDPRWGRNEETYGEDPFLASRIAVAFVKGMQGEDPKYLKTVATPKHFIANNEEIRRHTGSSDVSERNLREHYMPAFKAAVMEGGAQSVMCAYNALNGIPSCANSWLLTDVLRGEWGFDGYVVSDCWAVQDIVDNHKYVETDLEATLAAITAGTDLNCGNRFQPDIVAAVESGLLSEDVVDTALIRLFTARFKLGLFDWPEDVPFSAIPAETLNSTDHKNLAVTVAEKSITLLKNDGILPLDPSATESVAVIGPLADAVVFGGYSGTASNPSTPFDGIQNLLSSVGAEVTYAKGSDMLAPISDEAFASAVNLAAASDVAIVVVGTTQEIIDEEQDRADIALSEPQQQLLEAVFEVNPKTIAVLVTGGPLAVTWADDHLPAILNAWYGGQAAGDVIAAVLFGNVNPSGRLPQTFYRSIDDLPPFDDYDIIGQKRTYMYFENQVLYPFGHGLSYTHFNYGGLALSADTVSASDTVTVSVDIENSGQMDGDEVVQVYVTDVQASVPTALRKLKGFKRVTLKAGAQQTVNIELDVSDFGFYDVDASSWVVEPGEFEIQVGASSADIRLQTALTVAAQ